MKVNKEVLFDTEIQVTVSGEDVFEEPEITLDDLSTARSVSGEEAEIETPQIVTKTIKIPTVTIKKAYSEENVFVKILKETDEFVIIDNYKDSELIQMGIDETLLENRKTLKMYDEAVMIEVEEK